MIIKFDERPDFSKLDIDTESLLEMQQLKDELDA